MFAYIYLFFLLLLTSRFFLYCRLRIFLYMICYTYVETVCIGKGSMVSQLLNVYCLF
jgi:hypothetical protein